MTLLEQLHKTHRRSLTFKVLPYTSSFSAAEDIVQEAFLKGVEKFQQFDKNKGSLHGWFVKILFSVLWDQKRKDRRSPATQDLESAPEEFLQTHDTPDELQELLQEVTNPIHRRVLQNVFALGYTQQETATLCGVTQHNVRKVVQRFREKVSENA